MQLRSNTRYLTVRSVADKRYTIAILRSNLEVAVTLNCDNSVLRRGLHIGSETGVIIHHAKLLRRERVSKKMWNATADNPNVNFLHRKEKVF